MNKGNIIIDQFSGGWSSGSRRGIEGSFRYGLGINFREDPDYITANKAAVKDSSTTVVDLPKWFSSYNAFVYAYGDTGKLYKRTTGTWAVARSVSNSTGQGLEVYGDYLYYRQNAQIGRMKLSDDSFTDDWKKSTDSVQTVTDWGSIQTFLDFVAFANGRYLATWNDSTFTYNKLSFPSGYFVRDLGAMSEYLVMGVNDNETITNVKRGFVFFWDGTSSTYNFQAEVPEAISSIQTNMDTVYIFGASGTIYEYNGKANKVKKIPYLGGLTAYVYPGGETNLKGLCHFGLAGGTSTTAYRGVYSWGKTDIGYPDSLNLEYPISTATTQGTTLSIGAVKAVGSSLYIGWKDNTTYGIDLVSTTTNQLSVIYESLITSANKPIDITREKLYFKPLASGESITLYVKADQGTWVSCGSASYASDGGTVTTKLLNYEFGCDDLEVKVVLAGTSTMPSLSKIVIEYEEDNNL